VNGILVLGAREVEQELRGREAVVLQVVTAAYQLHDQGRTAVPHSSFLRLPGDQSRRIMACPAFVGGETARAGIKWIASFPANVEHGVERASAVIVLNSMQTGRPEVLLEGAGISAARTAASAALAARTLRPAGAFQEAGLIGCGAINFSVVCYLRAAGVPLERVTVHDLDPRRAETFAEKCEKALPGLRADVAADAGSLLRGNELVSVATTATRPHIESLEDCPRGALVLHVSLRDIAANAIARCDNVVDDVDQVCRAQTSLHLAEQLRGDQSFIRCTLGDVLLGDAPPRIDETTVTVFSPFGLGALDVAVAGWVTDAASGRRAGTRIDAFFGPPPANVTINGSGELP
jgi:N-[(2S)-2-amino-2-carboxyethyl]-L-glutamate dehydrogenase